MAKTKILHIEAYPFASVEGTLSVPENVENTELYIEEHFDEIQFGEPELDYGGCSFDYSH